MNQRPGKMHRASAFDDMSEMKMRNFFKTCAQLLKDDESDEGAFYFNQIVDHINEGKSLPTDSASIARMLGM
jgi:hypothetical protein